MNNFTLISRFLINVLTTVAAQKNASTVSEGSIFSRSNVNINNKSTPVVNDIFITNTKLTLLENKNTIALLKDVMQLPEDFSQLITILGQKNKTNNGLITLNDIQDFINIHSKNAVVQLTELVSQAQKQGAAKNQQLLDVMKIVTLIADSNEQNPMQLMKTLILLYLPWVPLDKNIDFELSTSSDDENSDEADDIMTIVIQTVYYGLIKIVMWIENKENNSIAVKISCADEFPKKELLSELGGEGDKSILSKITYETIKLQKIKLKDNKQKIDMQSCKNINPRLLKFSQKIIRAVIDIDKRTELIERRRDMQ